MSKYGYNENELRKTIVTKIDKDGFHNRTVIYGKDSGGSESESSDFSTATIIFKNNTSTPFSFRRPVTGSSDVGPGLYIDSAGTFRNGSTDTIDTVLYKGRLMIPFDIMITSNTFIGDFFSNFRLNLSENVEIVDYDDNDYFCITGDCEITIDSINGEPV